jgi:hypothetical protein
MIKKWGELFLCWGFAWLSESEMRATYLSLEIVENFGAWDGQIEWQIVVIVIITSNINPIRSLSHAPSVSKLALLNGLRLLMLMCSRKAMKFSRSFCYRFLIRLCFPSLESVDSKTSVRSSASFEPRLQAASWRSSSDCKI